MIQHGAMRFGRVHAPRGICNRFRCLKIDDTETLHQSTAIQTTQRFDKLDKFRMSMKRIVSQSSVSTGLCASNRYCGNVIEFLRSDYSTYVVLWLFSRVEIEKYKLSIAHQDVRS